MEKRTLSAAPDAGRLNEDLIRFLAKQLLDSHVQENPRGPKLPNPFLNRQTGAFGLCVPSGRHDRRGGALANASVPARVAVVRPTKYAMPPPPPRNWTSLFWSDLTERSRHGGGGLLWGTEGW